MKLNKKSLVLLACVTLLLTFAVSGTVAFLADNSGPVINEFTPTEVKTDIDEDFDNKIKSRVVIQNEGTIPVYVRVAVVGNWYNTEGQIVGPWEDSISLNKTADTSTSDTVANGNWFAIGDYYYFSTPVAPGETTTNLLGASISETIKENGDYLVITVIHQSIQSEPDEAVESIWPVIVDDNNNSISAKS